VAKKKKKTPPIKLYLFGIVILWILLWSKIIIPLSTAIVSRYPNMLPIPIWWFFYNVGYFIALYLLMRVLIKRKELALRVTAGASLLFIGLYDLLLPPFCLQSDGTLLTTLIDQTCLYSTDSLVAWTFAIFTGWGDPLLHELTYTVGSIIIVGLGLLLLTENELISTLRERLS